MHGRTATCFGGQACVRGPREQGVGEALKRAEEIEPMRALVSAEDANGQT